MSFNYEEFARAERKGYCLGFSAGYSLFNEATTKLLQDLKSEKACLEETPAFKEFQARWAALWDTCCDLTEEVSRMDVVDHYRGYEAHELEQLKG